MYRKIKGTAIFNGTELLSPDNILVFEKGGKVEAIIKEDIAGEGIETVGGILCPGFVNTHCHVELSHLKNKIPSKTGLVNFVQHVMSLRAAPAEEIQAAIADAEMEMLKNGIVAAGDICNTTDSISIKQTSKLHWHNFIEISGFTGSVANKRLEDAEKIRQAFLDECPQYATTLSPHAPYSVSKELFSGIDERTAGQLISIHNQESAAENELYQNKTGDFLLLYKNLGINISNFQPSGKTSMQTWLDYFTNSQSVISVHNSFTDKNDLDAVARSHNKNFFFCLCPNANIYIENKLPPVNLLLKSNVNITFGTDSLASNNALNILAEIKTIRQNFPQIPVGTVLQWATINGAKALGIEKKFGSFDKGKQPGILVLENMNDPVKAVSKRII